MNLLGKVHCHTFFSFELDSPACGLAELTLEVLKLFLVLLCEISLSIIELLALGSADKSPVNIKNNIGLMDPCDKPLVV